MSDLDIVTEQMAEAASAFLATLSDAKRAKATVDFNDLEERRKWFYTPNERAGLPLIEMEPLQGKAALKLLHTGLREPAYNVAVMVMGLENVLLAREGFNEATYPLRAGASRFRDPSMYYFIVSGTPGDKDGWGWKVGGHHVSYQFTIANGAVYATPAFFGSNPAKWPVPNGRSIRLLEPEEDIAREIAMMLTSEQRKVAVLSPAAPTDIMQSNRPRIEDGALPLVAGTMMGRPRVESEDDARKQLGLTPEMDEALRFTAEPKGIYGGDMDALQRQRLTLLVQLYFDRFPEPIAAQYASQADASSIEKTSFAWAGPIDVGSQHYYRVQSQRLLIEFDNTQNMGNHIHSVWRDRELDFGGDVLAQHYAAAH